MWSHLDNAFGFRPSVHAKDWPSIHTRLPQFKFSLEGLWNGPQDDAVYDNLAQKTLNAFICITAPGEQVYALGWQHASYLVDLRRQRNIKNMKVSFFPDGITAFLLPAILKTCGSRIHGKIKLPWRASHSSKP